MKIQRWQSIPGRISRKLRAALRPGRRSHGESGLTLIETVVALAILGAVSVSFLNGMSETSQTIFIADEQATAESLAQSQMEQVKKADYIPGTTDYPAGMMPVGGDYANYSVIITAAPLDNPDDGIQRITVTVKHFEKTITQLESYKVNR